MGAGLPDGGVMPDSRPSEDGVVFSARASRYLTEPLVVTAVLVGLGITAAIMGPGQTVGLVAIGLACASQLLRVAAAMRTARRRWALELDSAGITWHASGFHLPWSMVEEIRSPRLLLRLLVPGVGLRVIDRRQAAYARRATSRPMSHAIDIFHLDATRA